jgi:hypothetical protein
MKLIYPIFILIFSFISQLGFSQNGYEMKEGETIFINETGNILNSNMPEGNTSKLSVPIESISKEEKNSMYNEDGTFKIPGYTPTGIQSEDEKNYKQAKLLLFQNNPQEYDKWFGAKPSNVKIRVRIEEFQKMPEIKQRQILANPDKYYLEDTNTNPINDN